MLNEHRVSVWDDETVLEMNSGDGYTTLGMYLMLLNFTLKMIKMVNAVVCVFYKIKKKGTPGRGYIFCIDTLLVISWEEKTYLFNQQREYKLPEGTESVS